MKVASAAGGSASLEVVLPDASEFYLSAYRSIYQFNPERAIKPPRNRLQRRAAAAAFRDFSAAVVTRKWTEFCPPTRSHSLSVPESVILSVDPSYPARVVPPQAVGWAG